MVREWFLLKDKIYKRENEKIISKVFPKRGEIYLVNFDPTIGSEIKRLDQH